MHLLGLLSSLAAVAVAREVAIVGPPELGVELLVGAGELLHHPASAGRIARAVVPCKLRSIQGPWGLECP